MIRVNTWENHKATRAMDAECSQIEVCIALCSCYALIQSISLAKARLIHPVASARTQGLNLNRVQVFDSRFNLYKLLLGVDPVRLFWVSFLSSLSQGRSPVGLGSRSLSCWTEPMASRGWKNMTMNHRTLLLVKKCKESPCASSMALVWHNLPQSFLTEHIHPCCRFVLAVALVPCSIARIVVGAWEVWKRVGNVEVRAFKAKEATRSKNIATSTKGHYY